MIFSGSSFSMGVWINSFNRGMNRSIEIKPNTIAAELQSHPRRKRRRIKGDLGNIFSWLKNASSAASIAEKRVPMNISPLICEALNPDLRFAVRISARLTPFWKFAIINKNTNTVKLVSCLNSNISRDSITKYAMPIVGKSIRSTAKEALMAWWFN